MERIQIADLDKVKQLIAQIIQNIKRLPTATYADIRLEAGEGVGAYSEDGLPKGTSLDWSLSLGVRVIAGNRVQAAGYAGRTLGYSNFLNLDNIIREDLMLAYNRAKAASLFKTRFKEREQVFGEPIIPTVLAPVQIVQDTIAAEFKIDPRSITPKEMTKLVCRAAKKTRQYHSNIKRVELIAETGIERQIFASSEGSLIDQTTCSTGTTVFILAQEGSSRPADLYHHTGGQFGFEAITQGKNTHNMDIFQFAQKIADETVKLSRAKPAPQEDKPTTVVLDPDLVALFAHEIIGHPSELDRALKMEAGYAGRSWFFSDLENTMQGKPVGSSLLNAFSDPTVKGAYGFYLYDDEGTPAKRVYHIKNGVFQDFLNSRETASIINTTPNGHYKANNASAVPLIRMSVSAIEAGSDDPKKIISEVEKGYYAVGHRIPSISESRENFSIAPRLMYKIENGEIKEVLRDGRITANSRDFFMSIDAVGHDFRIFPIPNCGKGQPMQAKQVGNGGPTIRAQAKIARGSL